MSNKISVTGPLQWFQPIGLAEYHLSDACIIGNWNDNQCVFTSTKGKVFSIDGVRRITSIEHIKQLNADLEESLFIQVAKELKYHSIPFNWDLFHIHYQLDGMAFRATIAHDAGIPVLQIWFANVCTYSMYTPFKFTSYFTDLYKNLSK